jgi:hypothetical protein
MEKPADFMVVLINGIEEGNLTLLRPVVHSFKLESGLVANVLWCKSINAEGPYLTTEAKLSSSDIFTHVRIPHGLVLCIVGSKNAPPMGFVWGPEHHKQPPELGIHPGDAEGV